MNNTLMIQDLTSRELVHWPVGANAKTGFSLHPRQTSYSMHDQGHMQLVDKHSLSRSMFRTRVQYSAFQPRRALSFIVSHQLCEVQLLAQLHVNEGRALRY